jgi:hypothetical protein
MNAIHSQLAVTPEEEPTSHCSKRFRRLAWVNGCFGVALLGIACGTVAAEPPGSVIAHSPAASRVYIGSPSIAMLPDGSYVASHDFFGGGSSLDQTAVFKSSDRGAHWRKLTELNGQWWSTLFVHRGELYVIGTSKQAGRIAIRRSADGGLTWTTPTNAASGWLTRDAGHHCAPVPVVEHHGRVWRAFEDTRRSEHGGKSLRAFVISAPATADLLNATNWTFSQIMPGNTNWLGGKFGGWLEGNIVVDRRGRVLDLLRVRFTAGPEKAAVIELSADGASATFSPETGFLDFPGGAKKFTIRFDPQTQMYWSLANTVPEPKPAARSDLIRNTLSLVSSPDLARWTERAVVLHHPDHRTHAFQYADWLFDGEDLIAVSRTAYDDATGGAHNGHDANYLTFHRIERFRQLRSAPVAPPASVSHETADLLVSGRGFVVANFAEASRAFANRKYVWRDVPAKFRGWTFTQTSGGESARIHVRAKRSTLLFAATALPQPGANFSGWEAEGSSFRYDDAKRTRMTVFRKRLAAGQELDVPQANWSGMILLFPN